MKITKGKSYQVKGNSKYFFEKYGTSNPIIRIEDKDTNIFIENEGNSNLKGWGFQRGNPACLLFAMRAIVDLDKSIDLLEGVYYGKISLGEGKLSLGELVHESELEEIT